VQKNFYRTVRDNRKFQEFVLPMEELKTIRDAMLFVRQDGLIVFSEGYFHPPGQLIANIIYVPDPEGKKSIFGRPYRSLIKKKGAGGEDEWIDYEDQIALYREIAPESQINKPLFAEYKCRFELAEMIGFVDHRRSLEKARRLSAEIDDSMRKVAGMLGIGVETIGATGSMALGNLDTAHDFDLVFYGTTARHWEIVERIYRIVEDPARQVFEMGMLWAIRFYDDWGNMICPFFSYLNPEEIPLKEFSLKLQQEEARLTAGVSDDTHTFYMPSLLELGEVELPGRPDLRTLTLILYHGGLRGEYRKGDRIRAAGKLVEVRTPDRRFPALLCTNLTDTEKIAGGR
jgi:predicted nucleotidyltransferase